MFNINKNIIRTGWKKSLKDVEMKIFLVAIFGDEHSNKNTPI